MITADELASFPLPSEETMMDTCVILTYTGGTQNPHGTPMETWTESTPTPCGTKYPSSRQVLGGAQVPVYDAVMRVPLATVVTITDRVRHTHRYGTPLARPQTYTIERCDQGLTCFTLGLKRVGDGE